MFLAVLVFSLASTYAVDFKNCNGNLPVQLDLIQFPEKLILREGEKLDLKARLRVSKVVGSQSVVHVTIRKSLFWGKYLTIPCIKQVGSCSYDIDCNFIRQHSKIIKTQCPPPVGESIEELSLVIPKIPSVASFLAGGSYKVKAELKDKQSNELLACVEAELQLET